MVRSVGAQWLRGLMRAGKAQQRTTSKLVKQLGLLAVPLAKPKVRSKPVLKAVPRARPAAGAAVPAPIRAAAGKALPGQWLTARYVPPTDLMALADVAALAGRSMNYWLYLPARAPSLSVRQKGWPLVVMLHGCEQSATQFAQGTGMNRLAEQKGFAVLYPQQSLGTHAHRCWKWYDKPTQDGGGDVRLIVGIIEHVAHNCPIDRSRIYIGGISAGAGMANIVALNHPQLIAAVGLHSGPVFGAGHNALGALGVMQHGASHRTDSAIAELLARSPDFPAMPTILIQGEGDRVVRAINQTHLTRQSLLLNRVPADSAVSVVLKPGGRPGSRNPANAHRISDFRVGKKVLLRVAQIAHLAHAWSGGDASLAFNAKAGPSASKMMLEFFAQHRRER